MNKRITVIVALLALAGCAPQVQMANPSSITITYDRSIATAEAGNMAQQHCRQYGRDAIPSGISGGIYATQTYICR